MLSRSTLAAGALALVVAVSVAGVTVAVNPSLLPSGEYDRTTVTVVEDGTNETLATVEVRVADTYEKRYTGLSDTESLGRNEGMLFVHDAEDQRAYVMRKMDFPIDIVFVDGNGTITEIHHAELPPEGTSGDDLKRYSGTGKYVLEVPYGFTNDSCIEEGDRIRIADY
jgi:hypothetical protein